MKWASETHERTLHGQEQNAHAKHERVTRQCSVSNQHTSTITCTAAPRVWDFSAFHCTSAALFVISMQGHFITSSFRISLVNPLFCAPDCCYGELYSGVCLTAALVNSTLVCAWLLLWWTLLWCVPNCSYGELYSGVCLTAGMVNSTLVYAWLLLWWTLLWCVPNCWYGELYSGVCLTATTMSNEPVWTTASHSPTPLIL